MSAYTKLTDGTVIRLSYQVDLYDPASNSNVTCDAGREFIAIDGADVNNLGWSLPVVEPDEYGMGDDPAPLVVTDPDCFQIVGPYDDDPRLS